MDRIRMATADDAARMLEIYAPHIRDSAVSFETEVPSAEEFRARVDEYLQKFPWLVYTTTKDSLGEIITAFAYASTHRTRAAYVWTAECTVYVDPAYFGRGIGTRLYRELFARLREQGVVNVLAGITQPNAASVGIHEALGFEKFGIYRDVGFKLGRWWDVGWWQLQLQRPDIARPLSAPVTRGLP